MDTTDERPRAGPSAGQALIRARAEDFRVEEYIEMAQEGQGEHLWLRVRKTGENTEYVARLLARAAGVDNRAVGFAGRKDRHAVTTQWFSIHLPGKADPALDDLPPTVEVLERLRRPRKLQVGGLRANRFGIRLRDARLDRDLLAERIAQIPLDGVPNYFGEQRFGRDAGNLQRANAWFRGALRVCDRAERGLLISAARSALFNAVLAERVRAGNWNRLLPGEAVLLDGSHSFFHVDGVDELLLARLAAGDVHPSGPLWGQGEPPSTGEAGAIERAVAAGAAVFAEGLAEQGLRHERRSLRLLPRGLAWRMEEGDPWLSFELPPGCYATTVLSELLDVEEPAR
ncbi:MAG: tRNA pseudouridine(13) synthase TruD [Gammaproteobacteria bacterium]